MRDESEALRVKNQRPPPLLFTAHGLSLTAQLSTFTFTVRTKVTLVLVFLNVALFFFIFKFEHNWHTERTSLETRRRVLGPEVVDPRSLTITSTAPNGSFSLARRGDTWWLTSPLEWPANIHAVNSLINELRLLDNVSSFNVADLAPAGQKLADFGLEKPRLTVTFGSGDAGAAPSTLRIGDTTKDGTRLYVLSTDGARVHVVNRSLADSLSLTLDQLRADTLLDIPVFEAHALSVQFGGVRVRIRRESARWLFDTIIDARASKTALEVTLNALNALHPKTFNPPNPPATLPSAAPALRITIEGNNRNETLFVGDAIGSTAIPAGIATAPDVEYFAQLEGRPALFTVAIPATLMDALKNAPFALREKRVLDFEPRNVTAITLATPVLPNQPPLTLQRLEPPAGSAPDAAASWQIVQRGGAAQGPQTLPADRAAVQRLLEQLAALAAKSFPTNAATNTDLENWGFKRPEREVTLTLGAPAAPLVLDIGSDTSRELYALVGPGAPSPSVYAIDKNFLDELPVSVRAWRQRQLPELPAVARVTALKLTDLVTNSPVLDVTLDATGHPPDGTKHAAAIETLVAQLRRLRAKSFPQDGYTERIVAAGEERPWKYKLDYTVSLPGGAAGEQTTTKTLVFTDRVGGSHQFAGSAEFDAVFEIEQPFLDALQEITYGDRDPGPPPPSAETPNAKTPNSK